MAGNHCAAWEAPNSTMVVFDSVSPNWQRRTVASVNELSQPSTKGGALSAAASRRLGSRFDGPSRVATAPEIAADSGALIASTRASHGLWARSSRAAAARFAAVGDDP